MKSAFKRHKTTKNSKLADCRQILQLICLQGLVCPLGTCANEIFSLLVLSIFIYLCKPACLQSKKKTFCLSLNKPP